MRKLYIMILILFSALILVSCSGIEEPRVNIYTESQKLENIHLFNRKLKERELHSMLETVMVGKRFTDLPTITAEDEIIIEATNFEAKEYKVTKFILDESVNIVSDFEERPFFESEFVDGKGTVSLKTSAEFESYEDYKVEGKSIVLLLFETKIHKSNFTFGTIFLFENDDLEP